MPDNAKVGDSAYVRWQMESIEWHQERQLDYYETECVQLDELVFEDGLLLLEFGYVTPNVASVDKYWPADDGVDIEWLRLDTPIARVAPKAKRTSKVEAPPAPTPKPRPVKRKRSVPDWGHLSREDLCAIHLQAVAGRSKEAQERAEQQAALERSRACSCTSHSSRLCCGIEQFRELLRQHQTYCDKETELRVWAWFCTPHFILPGTPNEAALQLGYDGWVASWTWAEIMK